MNEMQRWLTNYEHLRHSKQPNESWISFKYPIEGMHWRELQQLYLPELNMNWGQAISALKRSWKAYRIAGRNGESRGDFAWRINRIKSAMGLEKSNFPELEGMDDEDQELTDEEIQLKREEKEENGGDFGTSEEESEFTEEWSDEDKQLLKEEREAEDDWWFS